MTNPLGQLGKDTLIYGLGDMARRSVGFLLIPLYTRYLAPSSYGYLELLSVLSTVLTIIGSQGLGTAFFRHFVDAEDGTGNGSTDLVSTALLYMFGSTLVFYGTVGLFAGRMSVLIFGSGNFQSYILVVATGGFFASLALIPLQYLRASLRSLTYAALSLVQFLLVIAANVTLVAAFHLGIKGILLGTVLGNLFVAGVGLVLVRSVVRLQFNWSLARSMVLYGLPLVPSALSLWVLQVSDRFLLQRLSSATELGLYALGSRFASLIGIGIVGPFQMAWGPLSFHCAKSREGRRTLSVAPTYFLLVLSWAGIGVAAFAPLVIRWVAQPDFWMASRVVPYLVCANMAYGMFLVFAFGAYYAKKTGYLALVVVGGAIVNILGNLLLIPRHGMIGAAVASLVSYAVILVLALALSQNYYPIAFEKLRLISVAALYTVFLVLLSKVGHTPSFAGLALRGGVFLAFPLVLLLGGFFTHDERIWMRTTISRLAPWRANGLVRGLSSALRRST